MLGCEKRLYRMTVDGGDGVGKTGIISRYVSNTFSENSEGYKYSTYHRLEKNDGLIVDLLNMRHPRFAAINNTPYRRATAHILVYDITSQRSFDYLKEYLQRIMRESCSPEEVPIFIGNKSDKEAQRQVSPKTIEVFIQLSLSCNLHFMGEVSALNGGNIEDVFSKIVEEIEAKKRAEQAESTKRAELAERFRKLKACVDKELDSYNKYNAPEQRQFAKNTIFKALADYENDHDGAKLCSTLEQLRDETKAHHERYSLALFGVTVTVGPIGITKSDMVTVIENILIFCEENDIRNPDSANMQPDGRNIKPASSSSGSSP